MAIRDWHWGKILLCWVAAGASAISARAVVENGPPDERYSAIWVLAVVYMAAGLFAAPAAAFVVTWKWLSGKERKS
jgi:hypothetical protein